MILSILLCLGCFGLVVRLLRSRGASLGLPLAYLYLLLLIHVPGAIAHALPWSRLSQPEVTAVGIQLTAFGCLAYVAGLWLARLRLRPVPLVAEAASSRFLKYCVVGGWVTAFGLAPWVGRTPSLNALVNAGGTIWMVGVMLGLAKAMRAGNRRALWTWLLVIGVYPAVILVRNGFLSYGTNAAIKCLAPLVLVARTGWRAWTGVLGVTALGMGLFSTYFSMRNDLRALIKGKEDMEERIAESSRIVTSFRMFDAQDEEQLSYVHQRLNQNYFVGLAHMRLKRGVVDYYKGRTVIQAIMAVIPRALWPEKPVFGGSPEIIETMTGFKVGKGTSYGVGNVLEFYINFGLPSLIGGFLLLGWVLGRMDAAAAGALAAGNMKGVILRVMPSIALIQPEFSVVEMCGGAAAAWVAAWIWYWIWGSFVRGPMLERRGFPSGKGRALDGGLPLPVPVPHSDDGGRGDGSPSDAAGGEDEREVDLDRRQQRDDFRF